MKNETIAFTVIKTESGNVEIKDNLNAYGTMILYPQEALALYYKLGEFLDLDKPSTSSNPPPDEL
jgi:hypothetical protein